jgi:cobyrinic acid a,c-diamide synthase
MVGVVPAEVNLIEKPEGHGYVVAKIIRRNPLFQVGMTVRGHEFHHSNLSPTGPLQFAYKIDKGKGIAEKKDGIVYKNLFASYVHLHASGVPEWAESFVTLACHEKERVLKSHGENKRAHFTCGG